MLSFVEPSCLLWRDSLTLVFKLEAMIDSLLCANKSIAGCFVSSQWQQKWSNFLHTFNLKEGESIQAFISQFNMATLEIHDLDQSIMMSILMSGLQKNDLNKSLIKTYPRDFIEMLAWAEKYAWMEDIFMQERNSYPFLTRGWKVRG